jgi:DNA-directed RNA polymerase III subunit RPC6
MTQHIADKGFSAVELADEHIQSLLQLMIYDGMIEKVLVTGLKGNHGKGDVVVEAEESEDEKEDEDEEEDSDDEVLDSKKRKHTSSDEESKPKKKKSKAKGKKKSKKEDQDSSDDDDLVRAAAGDASESSDDGYKSKYGKARFKSAKRALSNHDTGIAGADYVYRLIKPYKPILGWTDMPCGNCPSESFCAEPPRPLGHHHLGKSPYTSTGAERKITGPGQMKGVGMLGGAGAAIGSTSEKWGQRTVVGSAVAPVNPRDCRYFKEWLDFSAEDA